MKKYGIKCITTEERFTSVYGSGWGGWQATTRGWETWCKTPTFPYDNLNLIYHELLRWGSINSNAQYSYVVEEVPEEGWSLAAQRIVNNTSIDIIGATGPTGTRSVIGVQGSTGAIATINWVSWSPGSGAVGPTGSSGGEW